MILLSAQGAEVGQIAKVAFTSEDRVREVIHNFNADDFESLYPKYSGGRPPTFSLPERQAIKKARAWVNSAKNFSGKDRPNRRGKGTAIIRQR